MTAPVTRFTIATPVPSATRTGGYDMAYTDVVLASDYDRLEQECERLREALQASGDELGGILCTTGPARDEWMRQLIERIDAALQHKQEETPNAN